jgi:hypothetical protein
MVRTLTIASVTLFAVAGLSAQAPSTDRPAANQPAVQQPAQPAPAPATPQTPAASPSQASDPNKVTMTGCLKPGATAGTWTLETAAIPSASSSPSSPVGTSGAAKRTFNLTTKPSDDLKPHANHKIEVVGTVSAAGMAGAAADAAAKDAAPRQNFTVESFKMVSPSCQ